MCKLNMFQKSTEIYQSLKIQERETQGDVLHNTNHFFFYELLQTNEKQIQLNITPKITNS